MNHITTLEIQQLQLNGQPAIRSFSAEVRSLNRINGKIERSHIALFFTMQMIGVNPEGNLEYRIHVTKRLFLDEKGRPVFKPSKAQKIALAVAKINDILIFEVNRSFQLLGVSNIGEIRSRWQSIRINLLQTYPDLETLCNDFDWQLQEENIQSLFQTDNFYNFFFASIFYQEFEEEELPSAKKVIANGFDRLNIPIIEKRSLTKQDMLFENITIETEAELDTENGKFPLEKMNISLGRMIGEIGANHDLEFTYNGSYQLKPRIGVITGGTLEYEFNIPEVYQKKTTINFNLENDER